MASAATVFSRNENVIEVAEHYQNPKSNSLRKLQSAYPTEYTCVNSNYGSAVDITYSYSIETSLYVDDEDITMTSYIDGIIRDFEGELLIQLAEELLICSGAEGLAGIVGISSSPSDAPSSESKSYQLYSHANDIYIFHSSLYLYFQIFHRDVYVGR